MSQTPKESKVNLYHVDSLKHECDYNEQMEVLIAKYENHLIVIKKYIKEKIIERKNYRGKVESFVVENRETANDLVNILIYLGFGAKPFFTKEIFTGSTVANVEVSIL